MCSVSSDNKCYSCNDFTAFATEYVYCIDANVVGNYHSHSRMCQCRPLDDAADKCKTELVHALVTCGWCCDSTSYSEDDNSLDIKSAEHDFSNITSI